MPLIYELDFVLDGMRVVRVLNLLMSLAFDIPYLFFVGNYISQYGMDWFSAIKNFKKATGEIVSDWVHLGIQFTLMMCLPNFLLNVIAIIKEGQFYLFTVSNEFIQLTWQDLLEANQVYFSLFNPIYWFQIIFKQVFRYDAWDLVRENPNNESHFYLNMWV